MAATSLNPKETAKVLRTVLKNAFPQTTFGITTGRGAGVSSVDVRWMDGPTVRQVEAITRSFEIGTFNGMTDSYEYSKREDRQVIVDGHFYEAGCRYVMTARSLSAAKANECIKMVADYWGGIEGALPVAVDTEYGYQIEGGRGNERVREDLHGHEYDWSTQIHRCASDPSRFVHEPAAIAAAVDALEEFPDSTPVVFANDYGDRGNTMQVGGIDEVVQSPIRESGYSNSGWALPHEAADSDGEDDDEPKAPAGDLYVVLK
jgi:Large polyvalent protein associated domain 29